MPPQHRQAAFTIGRVAGSSTSALRPVLDLVAVVRLAPALADDVGVRLEQTHHLLAGRHRFAGKQSAPPGFDPGRRVPRCPLLSYATSANRDAPPSSAAAGRWPPAAARRAPSGSPARAAWQHGSGRDRHLRQPLARLIQQPRQHDAVVQQAARFRYPSRHGAVDAHLRTRLRSPAARPASARIACHVSASIAPTALCNADFFGTRNGSTRAKRCTEAESTRTPTPDSCSRWMSTAQRRWSRRSAQGDPRTRSPARAHVEQFGVLISHASALLETTSGA